MQACLVRRQGEGCFADNLPPRRQERETTGRADLKGGIVSFNHDSNTSHFQSLK